MNSLTLNALRSVSPAWKKLRKHNKPSRLSAVPDPAPQEDGFNIAGMRLAFTSARFDPGTGKQTYGMTLLAPRDKVVGL